MRRALGCTAQVLMRRVARVVNAVMSSQPNATVAPATFSRLTLTGFLTLLLIALMMGANHVAARTAFNHGVDVVTAVTVRSTVTALVVALILWQQKVSLRLSARQQKNLLLIGGLIAVQSVCLYSSVARLPVALALLAFNTYPLSTALWARLLYGHRPEKAVLLAMPLILVGLALALDVLGAASGLGAAQHWGQIGVGVAFALTASATFGLALVITQHETTEVDGRLRTFTTMVTVAVLAAAVASTQGGFHLPTAPLGWWGLGALTFLYGTAFTIMFTVLPKLGVVGNSAIMNVEPVFALVLAWAVLGQSIAFMQLVGALVVVATVMWLGLRKR
jgi:drug/metabolite transporter (DMT)-like permease